MTRAYVHAILPSLFSSSKLASTGEIIGTMQQDRATAIAGTLGAGPTLIPISMKLTSDRGTTQDLQDVDRQRPAVHAAARLRLDSQHAVVVRAPERRRQLRRARHARW